MTNPSAPPLVGIPGVPSVPSYGGSATPTTASTGSNPNDIWGLGTVYDKPVFLGMDPVPPPGDRTAKRDHYGKTQDMIQQVINLYARQSSERKKNPNGLTQYEQIQQALYAGGFYGQLAHDKIHTGQWSPQTQSALVAALDSYVQVEKSGQPITFTDFLTQNAGGNGDGGFYGSQGKAAPQVNLADPAALRSAAQQAAQAALGHGLTDDQLGAFVTQFQASQATAQTSTGAQVTTPDVSSQAMQFAQASDPTGASGHNADSYVNSFLNLFLPSTSGRANINETPKV